MINTVCAHEPCQNLLHRKPGQTKMPKFCSQRCRARGDSDASRARKRELRLNRYVPRDLDMQAVCSFDECQNLLWRKAKFGVWPRYCSPSCRSRADYARRADQISVKRKAQYEPKRYERDCAACGEPFVTGHISNLTCSKKCREQTNPHRCGLDGCDRPHRAKGLCAVHWVAADRAANGRKKEPWNDRARHAYHSRRAQKIGSTAEGPIRLTEIGDRDEWRCGICEEPISPVLAYPDPASPSLDHIKPLSQGGTHVPGNVQVAHLRCNQSKGSRT